MTEHRVAWVSVPLSKVRAGEQIRWCRTGTICTARACDLNGPNADNVTVYVQRIIAKQPVDKVAD